MKGYYMENKEIENQNVQNNNMTQPEQNIQVQEQVQQATPEEQIQPKKKSMFNGEEEVIYTFEEEKEGNPLIPILLFVALRLDSTLSTFVAVELVVVFICVTSLFILDTVNSISP